MSAIFDAPMIFRGAQAADAITTGATRWTSRRRNLRGLFASPGTQVAIGRRGNDYELYQELADRWWRIRLTLDGAHHSLWQSVLGIPVLSDDQNVAAWTYFNASHVTAAWTLGSNANTFGGSYVRQNVAGWHTEYTATGTVLGLHYFAANNAGLALVAIDGDKTKATSLPTAQDVVNAGAFPNTILVANGGTLNGSDRVLDMYAAATNPAAMALLATGLSNTSHVVRVTVTGYKQAASVDTRIYISGGMRGPTTINAAGMTFLVATTLLNASSVYEYAISCLPQAGGTIQFMGNRHGGEANEILGFQLDGLTVAPIDGQILVGTEVQVTRATELSHPDLAHVADVDLTYTMRPTNGLHVDADLTWLQPMNLYNVYLGMLPTEGDLCTKGCTVRGETVTLLTNDGTLRGSHKSDAVALWAPSGDAVLLSVPDLEAAVGTWTLSPNHLHIEDRTGGDLNKAYLQRSRSTVAIVPVTNGDRWTWGLDYQATRLASADVHVPAA